MEKLYICVFQSTDGHGCSEPIVAVNYTDAENQARQAIDNDDIEIDELYCLSEVGGYKIILKKL